MNVNREIISMNGDSILCHFHDYRNIEMGANLLIDKGNSLKISINRDQSGSKKRQQTLPGWFNLNLGIHLFSIACLNIYFLPLCGLIHVFQKKSGKDCFTRAAQQVNTWGRNWIYWRKLILNRRWCLTWDLLVCPH